MAVRRNRYFAPLTLIVWVLGSLALLGAKALRQGHVAGLFPWQDERFYRLLLVAAIWFFGSAGILVIVACIRRSQLPPVACPCVNPRTVTLLLIILNVTFAIAYGWLSITRHQRFNSTGYDLAINEQIVWNTLHGRFFASSPEVDNSFADHFRPFLLAVVPFYAIFPSPLTLLVLQTLVLAMGAVPLYYLARHKLSSSVVALGVASAYLLYPSVGFVARFDFHIEAFAVPAFIAAFYALERNQWKWASFWLVIPLLCKENMGLTVAAFGLYALLFRRKYAFGTTWIVIGLFTFAATSFWLIPTIRGESPDALNRYDWLGHSPQQILVAMITRPVDIWHQITEPARLLYLLQLLLPVGFLALIGLPELIPVIPGLMLNLLAQHHCQPTIYCQYTVPVIPFVFVATVCGLFRIRSITSTWVQHGIGVALVLLAFLALWVDNPFAEEQALPSALAQTDNAEIVKMALQTVSAEGSLVTTNDYAPHLAQREELYIIGIPSQREPPIDPNIVFINLYDQEYIICDQYREYVSQLDIAQYGVVFRTGGLIVIQRNAGSNELFQDFILNWNDCAG